MKEPEKAEIPGRVFKLSRPVKIDIGGNATTLVEVRVREPREAGDLFPMDKGEGRLSAMAHLITHLSGLPLGSVSALPPQDFLQIVQWLSGFLGSGLGI